MKCLIFYDKFTDNTGREYLITEHLSTHLKYMGHEVKVLGMSNTWFCYYRSSHQRCSITKDVLRNFAKFTRKHLPQSLF